MKLEDAIEPAAANKFDTVVVGPESSSVPLGAVRANDFGVHGIPSRDTPAAVPEPSTLLLAIVGIIGLSCYRRRRHR